MNEILRRGVHPAKYPDFWGARSPTEGSGEPVEGILEMAGF